jgi:hypothetical protein
MLDLYGHRGIKHVGTITGKPGYAVIKKHGYHVGYYQRDKREQHYLLDSFTGDLHNVPSCDIYWY